MRCQAWEMRNLYLKTKTHTIIVSIIIKNEHMNTEYLLIYSLMEITVMYSLVGDYRVRKFIYF